MSQNTFRDIYRWGDKREEIVDDQTLTFFEGYFKTNRETQRAIAQKMSGNIPVVIKPSQIDPVHIAFFKQLLGEAYVKTSDFDRANHALGKFYTDLLYMRNGQVPYPPDVVLSPSTHEEVQAIIDYCHTHKIPVLPFAGGTSVTRALEATKGGVSLDVKSRLNKLIEINPINQTVRVQAGMLGPDLEAQLNKQGFTCGHYPQSFEYATVGGWVAAKGAGQCSTGYGRAEDLMVALKVATPIGTFENQDFPTEVQGWDLSQMFLGSEGVLGVITEVTWKIFKYRPENRQKGSFFFKDFETAALAMREMIQGEFGKPHLFRISDGQETQFAFSHKGYEGTWKDKALRMLGYHPPKRSKIFVTVEGDAGYTKLVYKKIKKTARKHGALPSGSSPINIWLEQRYSSSYLRDGLMDAGYMVDTLETAVTWDKLIPLWNAIHAYFDKNPNVYGMSHVSHVYENGCNIYAIFFAPMKDDTLEKVIEEFNTFQQGIIRTFVENGGSITHHHGTGRMGGDFMAGQLGQGGMTIIKGIKDLMDPHSIMNPGNNMLGLDR